jgi:hypothetical protein
MCTPCARLKDLVAPRRQEVALPIEDDQRMRAAMEQVDAIARVYTDARHVAEHPAVGQLGPILDDPVGELAAADDYTHVLGASK